RLQTHQVDDVDHAHLEVRQFLTKDVDGRKNLKRGDVTSGRHDNVGVLARGHIGSDLPDAEPPRAVVNRLIHREPRGLRLLAGDDDVDVVAAAQAVVPGAEQRVRVGWQVDADNL